MLPVGGAAFVWPVIQDFAFQPPFADGSWLARVPANVPLHLQTIDKFGMSIFNEPVWFSGRKGEARVCGGCHEDRTGVTEVQPGLLQAFAAGPIDAKAFTPRKDCQTCLNGNCTAANFTRDNIIGAPWDQAIQRVLDAKCVSCHGDSNTAGIAPYTITDPATGQSIQWTFNLTGNKIAKTIGGVNFGDWSASYISLAGPDMEALPAVFEHQSKNGDKQ